MKGPDDPFGCKVPPNAYKLPSSFEAMINSNGFVSTEVFRSVHVAIHVVKVFHRIYLGGARLAIFGIAVASSFYEKIVG